MVCEKFGIRKYYPNHEELLNDHNIEAIVAIVRRKHTAALAFELVKKGLPIFIEKPMAPTVQQGDIILKEALKSKAKITVGYMRRHDAGVVRAKQLFKQNFHQGDLGKLLYFNSYYFGGRDYCNNLS